MPAGSGGLVVAGAPGHQVPPEVWQAVRAASGGGARPRIGKRCGALVIGGMAGSELAGLVTEQVLEVPGALADAAQAPQRFSPGMLSAELAGTGTSDLTAQQVLDAGQVLAGLPDGQIARRLAGLPGPERWQAESWVLQVTTVAPQVALAGRYLAGELVELTGTQLRSMIAGLAPSVARQTALDLLAAADDEQLGEIFADWPGMLALLEAAFPAGDGRRGQLEGFLAGRFGGRAARAACQGLHARADQRGAGRAVIRASWSARQLNLVAGVLGPLADEAVLAGLTGLSQVQWQRARRWLRGARQAIADVAEARDHLSGERRGAGRAARGAVRQPCSGSGPVGGTGAAAGCQRR